MKDKEMEKLIDACCEVMFQRDEEVEKWLDEQYDKLDQQEYEMQEIGLIMHGQSDYYYQNPDEYEKDRRIVELENEVMRLEHRLSNSIEPKFKVGQEVWHCFKNCNEPDKTIIDWIDVEITENFIDFTYYDVDGFGFDEIMLFTTEEEAKKHLEELKNGN